MCTSGEAEASITAQGRLSQWWCLAAKMNRKSFSQITWLVKISLGKTLVIFQQTYSVVCIFQVQKT